MCSKSVQIKEVNTV